MRATALAYGFDAGALKIVRTLCARLDIRLRRVTPEEYARPLGSFFSPAAEAEPPAPAGDIPGPMLVLAGLTDRQMDALLSSLRTARAPASLKAVLTEHNARWSGPVLYGALAQESAALGG